jgi:hypothetical protein
MSAYEPVCQVFVSEYSYYFVFNYGKIMTSVLKIGKLKGEITEIAFYKYYKLPLIL